mmetsp:Transcript_27207/g.42285  ORF Transcript_27207/g.42285 Transcript_27207/m.42285 type:complete len:234 (+) Transcript_27207:1271-1972(+)
MANRVELVQIFHIVKQICRHSRQLLTRCRDVFNLLLLHCLCFLHILSLVFYQVSGHLLELGILLDSPCLVCIQVFLLGSEIIQKLLEGRDNAAGVKLVVLHLDWHDAIGLLQEETRNLLDLLGGEAEGISEKRRLLQRAANRFQLDEGWRLRRFQDLNGFLQSVQCSIQVCSISFVDLSRSIALLRCNLKLLQSLFDLFLQLTDLLVQCVPLLDILRDVGGQASFVILTSLDC